MTNDRIDSLSDEYLREALTVTIAPGPAARARVLLEVPYEHRAAVSLLGNFLGNTGGGRPSDNLDRARRIMEANDWVRPESYTYNPDPRPLYARF